jgi:FlaG/FlaF family flagellin (archaellin)
MNNDDGAVADIVGSILLVGITVVCAALMSLLIFAFKGPVASPHASLSIVESPGTGGWNTGDEFIQITHTGGMSLQASSTVVSYTVNGGSVTKFTGTALGWTAGKLAIAQVWGSPTTTLKVTDKVVVTVVTTGGQSQLLATATFTGGVAS